VLCKDPTQSKRMLREDTVTGEIADWGRIGTLGGLAKRSPPRERTRGRLRLRLTNLPDVLFGSLRFDNEKLF
jgi:hypothetical protein